MAMTLFEGEMSSPGDRSTGLTERERRALTLSATGLVVADVAQAMGTSAGQVRLLLASAISKLSARSKLEAVIIAARRGDLTFPR